MNTSIFSAPVVYCSICGSVKILINDQVFRLIFATIVEKYPHADKELAFQVASEHAGNYGPWCERCDIPEWIDRALDIYPVLLEGQREGRFPMAAFPDDFGRIIRYVGEVTPPWDDSRLRDADVVHGVRGHKAG